MSIRDHIHLIAQHSNLRENEIELALKQHAYRNKVAWSNFFNILCISLGIGFIVSGIVFFFAYNWDSLHKFTKIGLAEALLITTSLFAVYPRWNDLTKKIILTGASVLVGVLFAVFGQVYQTGADAFDFFLAWTISISIWVVVSRFLPLWLLFLVLINTTVILYAQQVASDWTFELVCSILFVLHQALVNVMMYAQNQEPANWFVRLNYLISVVYATIGISFNNLAQFDHTILLLEVLIIVFYALSIWRGFKTRDIFVLMIIAFSAIIIAASFMIKWSKESLNYLMIAFFIILSVTLMIHYLINLQKKWRNEQ